MKSSPNSYTADSLTILKGLQPVTQTPGMYTDPQNTNHIIAEVIDNSVDECQNGYGNSIDVKINYTDSSIEVSVLDNGRGIPVGLNADSNMSGVELVFTMLHAGGKFDNSGSNYKISGGLHGVGISVMTALCSEVIVFVKSNKEIYKTIFENGGNITFTTTVINPEDLMYENTHYHALLNKLMKYSTGTLVYFKPDLKYFDYVFDEKLFLSLTETKALAVKTFICNINEISHTWNYTEGVRSILLNKYQNIDPIRYTKNDPYIDFAYNFSSNGKGNFFQYVNMIPVSGGSLSDSYVTALRQAISEVLPDLNLYKISDKEITKYFISAVYIRLNNRTIRFIGQTKQNIRLLIEDQEYCTRTFYQCFIMYLQNNKKVVNFLKDKYSSQISELSKSDTVATSSKKVNTDKIKHANNKGDAAELFIGEGDSALGVIRQSRFPDFQGAVAVRGKTLNLGKIKDTSASTKNLNGIFGNEIYERILVALGYNLDLKLKYLNYGKVIILTDADPDGSHIKILLIGFFLKVLPDFVKSGRLYSADAPLFVNKLKNKKTVFTYNQVEQNKFLSEHSGQIISSGRNKGLGEMDWEDLRMSSFDVNTRTINQITWSQELENKVFDLLGTSMDVRKEILFSLIGNDADYSLFSDEDESDYEIVEEGEVYDT